MKRIVTISLLLLAALAMFSCNRFDNTFGPAVSTFFDDYRDMAYAAIVMGDSTWLVPYYADDYLNNGVTKEMALSDFASLHGATGLLMELDRTQETDDGVRVQWTLSFTPETRASVTVVDLLKRQGDGYILVGNGATTSPKHYGEDFATDVWAYLNGGNVILDSYFTDDYYHDGQTEADVMAILDAILNDGDSPLVSLSEHDDWTYDLSLHITDTDLDMTLSTRARQEGNGFILCGNGQAAPDDSKQKVLVELFTATWCVNCPVAEEALYELKQEFGDRLYYMEYHVTDEFDLTSNTDLHLWYATGVAPTAVFQGQDVYIGASDGVIADYRSRITLMGNEDAHAWLKDFSHTLGQAQPFGNVSVDIDASVPTANLYLKWALVERSATGTNNEQYHQIVLARGQEPLQSADLTQPVSFAFAGVTDVPTDAIVYLWLQTVTDEYDPNTNKIYNAIEIPVE